MAYEPSKTVGRVAFFAHQDEIRDMWAKGHSNKEIFKALEAQLDMSYSQFNRYLVRYIKGENTDEHQRKGQGQKAKQSTTAGASDAVSSSRGETPTPATSGKPAGRPPVFKHNPDSDDFDGII